jgi:hypothetical protein
MQHFGYSAVNAFREALFLLTFAREEMPASRTLTLKTTKKTKTTAKTV